MITLLLLIPGAITALLLVVASSLISDEIRGWLELVPVALLRLVVFRVPGAQRQELYEQEWLPDLLCHLRKAGGRPITRLVVGVKFSVCLLPNVRAIARDLRELDNDEEAAAPSIPPDSFVIDVLPLLEKTGGASASLRGEGRLVASRGSLMFATATISATARVIPRTPEEA